MIREYNDEELPLFQETVLGELVLMNPRSKTSTSDHVTTRDTINNFQFFDKKEYKKNTLKKYRLLAQEPFVSPQASTNGWTDEIEVPPCNYLKKGGSCIQNEAENAESVQQGVLRLDEPFFNCRGMSDRDENEPNMTSPFIEQEIPQPDSSSGDMISDAPRANDILCAKGKGSFDHVGNRKFRSCIASHYQAYSNARSRSEKSSLIRSIVTHLVQEKGCRFLKRKSKNDHWYDIGFKGAECKVAHSFRDARSDRNKSIYKLHQLVRQVVSQPLLVPLTPTSPHEINDMEVYQEQFSPADQLSNVSYAVRGYDDYSPVSPPAGSCCCSRALDDFNEMSLLDLEDLFHDNIIRSNDITTSSLIQSTILNDKIECSCQVRY